MSRLRRALEVRNLLAVLVLILLFVAIGVLAYDYAATHPGR